MESCHGSCPFDVSWKTVWSIAVPHVPLKAVDAFLRDATPDGAVLCHVVQNKGFRVIQEAGDRVVALYNHDGRYSLISADKEAFLAQDWALRAAEKRYKKPGERLPYLRLT